MTNSLEAVTLYIPLMKDLHMPWEEIKRTPRMELEGILAAYSEYNLLHSMDGYEPKDIGDMAKHRPSIRGDWSRYMEQRRKYEELSGKKSKGSESALAELKAQL